MMPGLVCPHEGSRESLTLAATPRLATEPGQSAPLASWLHPAGQGPWEANCGNLSRPGCEFRFLHSELHYREHRL